MNRGATGNKTVIVFGGRIYETTAIPTGIRVTEKEGEALIRSGQAIPQQQTYQDQYPWTKPPK
jgi:hypothetical protein